MRWFRKDKQAKSAEAERTQEIISRVERELTAVTPLRDAVVKAAFSCAETMKPFIDYTDDQDKTEREILVLFEFLYFYMYLVNRFALGILGNAKRIRLQEALGPLVVVSTIELVFGHWPQHLKDGIRSDFYDKLNDAELEYASCTELLPKDKPLTGNDLFSRLARNVAELSGNESNPVTMTLVTTKAVDAFTEMDLERLVNEAAKGL